MTGNTSAASLYVRIFDREGAAVFSGFGGLDLLFELDIAHSRYVLREDRLTNEANIAEGVCVAFYPYFGEDVQCR